MNVIGVDVGASFADAVLFNGKKVLKTVSVERRKLKSLKGFLQKNFDLKKIDVIAVTGGRKLSLRFGKIKMSRVGELRAISSGASFLTKKKRFLAANIGTGTPLVFVEGKKWRHLGGTGVGGGTLAGLGKLLLNASPLQVERLALKGSNKLDLSVADITGGKIGVVPASSTASNYGKLATGGLRRVQVKKEDVAWSLLNLVAEVVARLSVLASRQCGCKKDIVVTGRVAANSLVKKRLRAVAKTFGCKVIVPRNAQFATAIGAARSV